MFGGRGKITIFFLFRPNVLVEYSSGYEGIRVRMGGREV